MLLNFRTQLVDLPRPLSHLQFRPRHLRPPRHKVSSLPTAKHEMQHFPKTYRPLRKWEGHSAGEGMLRVEELICRRGARAELQMRERTGKIDELRAKIEQHDAALRA
eukprot:gene7573-biopygen8501